MAANNITRTCLSAGIVINEILKNDPTVSAIARSVFPVVRDKADLPYVAYRRTQLSASPVKNKIPSDTTYMEVMCYTREYEEGVRLAEAVRTALDCRSYVSKSGMVMKHCILTDSEEGWENDAYLQQLIFEIKI